MKLILIQPAIGHRPRGRYPKAWLMEPLSLAAISGLTPPDIERVFYDDRLEALPYDQKADAVLLTIETYTARRAYEIAAEFRRRGVPVLAGGFHATLRPEEVAEQVDALVIGEAENIWPEVLDDLRHGTLRPRYQADQAPDLASIRMDYSLFQNKTYLPVALTETGRGCSNHCDFCAVQAFFQARRRLRPIGAVLADLQSRPRRPKLSFFVDDNFANDREAAKELLQALIPLKLKWVTQMSLTAAHDEELLHLMRRAGCQGVLMGFESLRPEALDSMGKTFNTAGGGYAPALAKLKRQGLILYATFVFGYDSQNAEAFEEAYDFALTHGFYIAAFNHLIPFPGTLLYERLEREGRLNYPAWWLEPGYRFNQVPFRPARMSAEELSARCYELRNRFYSWPSILKRLNAWNHSSMFMGRHFLPINILHHYEVKKRQDYPLGDQRI
jgi:Fe-S oxidoreductase